MDSFTTVIPGKPNLWLLHLKKKTLMLLNKKGEYLSFKEGKEAWREKRKDGRNTRNSHETIFSILEP